MFSPTQVRSRPATSGGIAPAEGSWLEAVSEHPLTLVRAAAGWGKTTTTALLWSPGQVDWFQLSLDDDLSRAVTGIAQSLTGDAEPVEDVASLLALLRRQLPEPQGETDVRTRTLVLDDSQLLVALGLEGLPGALLDSLGDRLRLVLLADRGLPEIEASRWARQALRVDATDLRLHEEQLLALAAREGATDVSVLRGILAATGGWPMVATLLVKELTGSSAEGGCPALGPLLGPDGPAWSFLAEQVFARLDEDRRQLLGQLSLIGEVDATTLADVLAVSPSEAGGELSELRRLGFARDGDGPGATTVLAPLVHRFVVTEELSHHLDARTLARDVVAGLRSAGQVAGAISVLTASPHAGAVPELRDLLLEHGDELLLTGETSRVIAAAERLQRDSDDAEHGLLAMLWSRALVLTGRWSEALRALDDAGALREGPWPAELALQVGLVHHFRGDLAEALAAYERGPTVDDGDPQTAMLAAWRASASWLRGDLEHARPDAMLALRIASERVDDRLLAAAHTAQALLSASDGDRRANDAHHRQALTAAMRAGDVAQQTRVRINRGSHFLEHGDFLTALRETDQAIELAQRAGYLPMLGIATCNRAEIYLHLGRLDQAVIDAERAIELFTGIGSRNGAYALRLLGDVRRERGDLVLAEQSYRRAVELAEPAGDVQGLVPALIGSAMVVAGTDTEQARLIAARAIELADTIRAVDAALAAAWVAFAQNDVTSVRAHLEAAEQAALERLDQRGQAEARTLRALIAPEVVEGLRAAERLWSELDAPVWRLRCRIGIAVRSTDPVERSMIGELTDELIAMGCSREGGTFAHQTVTGLGAGAAVAIRALGGFAVDHDGRPVPVSSWGSRKARDLLKLLVVRAGRTVHRDEIAHVLWPDLPYRDVANRFSVALSVVRTMLAPEGAEPSSPPIVADTSTVRLDPAGVELDVARFEQAAEVGLRAARLRSDDAPLLLRSAEAAYAGDLLEDDLDLPWGQERRAELRATYLAVTRTLADLHGDDPDLAVPLLLRLLDRDPYDEGAHEQVCRVLSAGRRHGEARRHHEHYRARMSELQLPARTLSEILG